MLRGSFTQQDGRETLAFDKRDRAITFEFGLGLHLPLVSSGLLQNICLKKSGSLAESYFKQDYCHACHTRFAVSSYFSRPARYAQDHKIKFPMLKEENVCNLFTIFESKKVYIQKLSFCQAFSLC